MWKRVLIFIGALLLLYAVYFIYQVITIRNQILSGNYNWEQYGAETSGSGGANISHQIYNVATADDPFVGASNPQVTIVEFGDFECPFCLKAYPIIRSLVAEFNQDVKYIYRDFPLEDIHPEAKLAAQAGYCAHLQNLFWPLHDKFYQNQDKLDRATIIVLAVQAGLNRPQFSQCLDSDQAKEEVEADQRAGLAAGVAGTPTWFINGYRVAGVIPADALRQVIEGLIKK
ncbi:MAG: DsbA family protein [Patescibacteria group bacterium]